MRGSKAKKLRRLVERVNNSKWHNETIYQPLNPSRVFARPPMPGDVLPNPSAIFTGHVTMDPNCTRALYQRYKQQYRRANSLQRRMS